MKNSHIFEQRVKYFIFSKNIRHDLLQGEQTFFTSLAKQMNSDVR